MNKTFNIVISGVGGQGLITLLNVLSEAAFSEGHDVKTSELHGLSQRGGSVEVYIRFGKKVWSPMISEGQANLVIALEQQEVLNGLRFASKNSNVLVNKLQTPTLAKDITTEELEKILEPIKKQIVFVPASEICQKELASEVVSGIYLLGYAISHNFLPLKLESIQTVIKKTMPEKYWELNLKALELGGRN